MIAKQRHITFSKQGLYFLLLLKVKSNFFTKLYFGINICTYIVLLLLFFKNIEKVCKQKSNMHIPDKLYSFRRV